MARGLAAQGRLAEALRLIDGEWHLFYSERFEVPTPGGTGHAVSTDLVDWTTTVRQFPEQGSPDLTRAGELAYGMTKGAVEAFTVSLSAGVGAKGITVNAVCCSGTRQTPLREQSPMNDIELS